jgi:hypothetical protein
VTAKLAPRLTTATAESSLVGLLMHAGATRKDDEFVEIFVYEDKGLDTRDVDMVTFPNGDAAVRSTADAVS